MAMRSSQDSTASGPRCTKGVTDHGVESTRESDLVLGRDLSVRITARRGRLAER